jgi:hypothetical protein
MAFPAIVSLILLLQLPGPAGPAVQQQEDPKASIEGIVVRIGSGEPVAGAEITLMRTGGPLDAPAGAGPSLAEVTGFPVPPSTTSDRNGRFVFNDVAAGSYRISTARNGYAKLEDGRAGGGRTGTGPVIAVAKGQTVKDIVLRLTPAGNVNGSVRDVSGEPLTGFQVLLLRSSYNPTGRRTFRSIASARTDDRGAYRFFWITPGRYYLSASFRNGPFENSGFRNPNEAEGKPYPTTYYPGTVDSSKAEAVEILPGEELNSIDFVLPQQELYRIRGKVIDARTGKTPGDIVELRMAPRQSAGASNVPAGPSNVPNGNQAYNPANGTFEFRGVGAGSYWIFASTQLNPDAPITTNTPPQTLADLFGALVFSRPTAQAAVEVSGSDVENVILTLTPGVSIPGRLSIDGQNPATIADFQNIHVALQSTEGNEHEPFELPRPMAPDGTFSLDNVPAGEYRLVVSHPQPDLYIREARLNAVDVLHQPLVISNAPPGPLDILLSSKAGQIEGRVINEQSQPVAGIQTVLIADRYRDQFDAYRTTVADSSGHFIFRGIAPGEYKIFAWEAIDDFAYYDPDFLRAFEQQGRPVSISESSRETADVKLIPVSGK